MHRTVAAGPPHVLADARAPARSAGAPGWCPSATIKRDFILDFSSNPGPIRANTLQTAILGGSSMSSTRSEFAERFAAQVGAVRALVAVFVRDVQVQEDPLHETALVAWSKYAQYDVRRPVAALLTPDEHLPDPVQFAMRSEGMRLEVRWKVPYPHQDHKLLVTLPQSLRKYPVVEVSQFRTSEHQYMCYVALRVPDQRDADRARSYHPQQVVNEVRRYGRVRLVEK